MRLSASARRFWALYEGGGHMLTKERLEEVLRRFPHGAESVDVVAGRTWVAILVSESFRNQDEAIRQRQVWSYLRQELEDDDLGAIEFIFTNAPGEDTSETAAA